MTSVIKLLGTLEISENGTPSQLLRSSKGCALLSYLIITGQPQPREKVADLLFESSSTAQSLKNLRSLMSRIRPFTPVLHVTRGMISFQPVLNTFVDLHTLRASLASPEWSVKAQGLQLYKGDLLASFYLTDAPRFNEWLAIAREELRGEVITAHRELCNYYAERQAWSEGVKIARHWVAIDDLDEEAYRWLMQLLINAGHLQEARTIYKQCQQALANELGVEPERATVRIAQQLEQQLLTQPDFTWTTSFPTDLFPPPPSELSTPGLLPPQSHMPFYRNAIFTGRVEELKQLANKLLPTPYTPNLPSIVAITGLGGIGKTQLAVEYAYRYGRFYPGGVYWLNFADPENIAMSFVAIGDENGLNLFRESEALPLEKRVKQIRQVLQQPIPRLLIFDNCEENELLHHWLPVTGGCRILITSRRHDWLPQFGVQTMPLQPLPRPHSVALLQQLAPRLSSELADAVATEIGDLPLALHLVGSFLHHYQTVDVATYLSQLHSDALLQHPSLQGEAGGASLSPTGHEQGVARTFQVSYQQLDVADNLDSLARRLLAYIAYCRPGTPLPQKFLSRLVAYEQQLTEARDLVLVEAMVANGVKRLQELGFIMREGHQTVLIHHLVGQFVLTYAEGNFPAVQQTIEATLRDWLQEEISNRSELLRLPIDNGHIRHIVERGLSMGTPTAAGLAATWGKYFFEAKMTHEGEAYLEAAITILRSHEEAFADDLATALTNYGGAMMQRTNALNVLPIFEEVVAIREKNHGPKALKTGQAIQNLGVVYTQAGKLESAMRYYQQALSIYHALPSSRLIELKIARVYFNLGALHIQRQDHQAALTTYQQALQIYQRWLDPLNTNISSSLGGIGLAALRMGDFETAVIFLRQEHDLLQTALGPEDLNTASSQVLLGTALERQGHYDEAKILLHKGIVRHETLNPNSASAAYAYSCLAQLYQQLGEPDRAISYVNQAVDIFAAIGFVGWEYDEAVQLMKAVQQ
ncbi:MAG: tetratricopeptide repeat protein [Anaerolineales bacterium]|nr:tetratricopeptide repeat protein [Anaerolineales bacterium]